ncbi:hypothetical protein E1508_20105 [Pseudomonas moraviensis]|nr:hypothetical protein E1508_20105 [Pseudomonas moraviensis]
MEIIGADFFEVDGGAGRRSAGRGFAWHRVHHFYCFIGPATARNLIVPTLCVGMQPGTLRVPSKPNAERPLRHSHAERGNDQHRRIRRIPTD